jgi:hypothetical protein
MEEIHAGLRMNETLLRIKYLRVNFPPGCIHSMATINPKGTLTKLHDNFL